MNLREIVTEARRHLGELVTYSDPQNFSDTFEGRTANALPGAPWVYTGTVPKVQSVSVGDVSYKMLALQAASGSGRVGVDISSFIASDTNPIHIRFCLYRSALSADAVDLIGVQEDVGMNATDEIQLLRLSTASILEIQTHLGWESSAASIAASVLYTVDLYLYPDKFDVYVDSVPITIGRTYYGSYDATTFGYLWVPANTSASGTCYIDSISAVGAPVVYGETQWEDVELGNYANEGVGFLRQVLPDACFERQIQMVSSNLVSGTQSYLLPNTMQRLLGVTANNVPVSIIPMGDVTRIKAYMAGHWNLSELAGFPIGWVLNDRLYLYPIPTSITNGLVIYYLPEADMMDVSAPLSAVPDLLSDLHHLVVLYTVKRAREKYHDDSSAVSGLLDSMVVAAAAKYGGFKPAAN